MNTYTNNSSHKITKKVLVLTGNEPLANKINLKDGRTEYKGLYYDIWVEMKNGLEDKYDFVEEFKYYNDYYIITELITKGVYDICIAPFSPAYDRIKLVNFTNSVIMDSPSILHYKRKTYFTTLYELIKDVFIIPIVLILVLGFIMSMIVYTVDKTRWSSIKGIKKIHYFRKAFLTVISSFFGEWGVLTGTGNLNIYNITIIIFILILSTIIYIYIQAVATDKIIDISKEGIYNRQNIVKRKFVTETGYDTGTQLQSWGALVSYDTNSVGTIVKNYLEDPSKYDGVVLDRSESLYYVNYYKYTHPSLVISYSDFGYIEECFVLNKKDIEFLQDVNLQIMVVQDSNIVEKVCRAYRDSSLVNYCIH